MDFNISLEVSQEELEEFPDFHHTTGTVVPSCQDSFQTPPIPEENTSKEEAIKERSTSVTTDHCSQMTHLPISSGPSGNQQPRFSHSVDDPCRIRERRDGRRRQRRQRCHGTH